MIPKNFILEEFVPKEIFVSRGSMAWSLLDERIIITAETIREYFKKKVIINNWKWNGPFSQRGLRTDKSMNDKAPYSQHIFGRAIDFDVDGIHAEEVRQSVLQNKDKFPYITGMELDVNWVHIDCRFLHNQARIKLFKA